MSALVDLNQALARERITGMLAQAHDDHQYCSVVRRHPRTAGVLRRLADRLDPTTTR